MRIEDFLPRVDCVKRTARGWSARCPAHEDRTPSLSIREGDNGQILLHCFAGCTIELICGAIALPLSALFADDDRLSGKGLRARRPSRPWRFDWRKTASAFAHHALLLRLHAEAVLDAAKHQDSSAWTDEDYDVAMRAVGRAYEEQERAEFLENYAFHLRSKELHKGRAQDAP